MIVAKVVNKVKKKMSMLETTPEMLQQGKPLIGYCDECNRNKRCVIIKICKTCNQHLCQKCVTPHFSDNQCCNKHHWFCNKSIIIYKECWCGNYRCNNCGYHNDWNNTPESHSANSTPAYPQHCTIPWPSSSSTILSSPNSNNSTNNVSFNMNTM